MVLDNFFPKHLIDSVVTESSEYEWKFYRGDGNKDLYWTKIIYGDNFDARKNIFISEFTSSNVLACWNFFKERSNCGLTNDNLDSVYFNGLTHGLEAHAHVDARVPNYVTVICYICENWNSHWGGETVFFDGHISENPADQIFYNHEITSSVLPRYNRIVIFDGNLVHAVRPISKSFRGIRKTLMFKIRDKNISEFLNLCN